MAYRNTEKFIYPLGNFKNVYLGFNEIKINMTMQCNDAPTLGEKLNILAISKPYHVLANMFHLRDACQKNDYL